jgi:hypothetical protein
LQETLLGLQNQRFDHAVARAQVLGPPAFVERMAEALGRPLSSRPIGRPSSKLVHKSVPN